MTSVWLLIGLAVLASVSPLLTAAKLYQMKEWRWDRLREHLRMTGIKTLISYPRVVIAVITVILIDFLPLTLAVATGMLALLGIGVAQFVLKRQPMPVWTLKAKAISLCALLVTAALALAALALPALFAAIVWLLLPLVQPLIVMLSCLLFAPVDRRLKRKIMNRASALRKGESDRHVIGIVGSVGKTTTKELIRHLLQDLSPLVTPEHVNTEMGVAQWLLRELPTASPSHPLVVEMGAYRQGEVSLLCEIVRPTMAVITALGSDHLALFGSEEAIVKANGEILTALPKGSHAFCAIDTDGGRLLLKLSPRDVTTVGISQDAEIRADDVQETVHGLSFTARGQRYEIPLRGRHHVTNILLALCVALTMDIPVPRIKELLKSFRPLKNTFNVRRVGDVTLVDDTYNASRLSMLAALDWAAASPERPRTLLTMGLLELGSEEDRIMEEIGKHAVGKIERAVFVSEPGAAAFERGFGKPVERLTPKTERIPSESLLLCVGRIPHSSITRLLP